MERQRRGRPFRHYRLQTSFCYIRSDNEVRQDRDSQSRPQRWQHGIPAIGAKWPVRPDRHFLLSRTKETQDIRPVYIGIAEAAVIGQFDRMARTTTGGQIGRGGNDPAFY